MVTKPCSAPNSRLFGRGCGSQIPRLFLNGISLAAVAVIIIGAAPTASAARPSLRRVRQAPPDGAVVWSRVPVGNAEYGALSSNGRWAITTERGARVRVTALSGGFSTRTLDNPTADYLHYARISPDGAWAVGVGKRTAVVWNLSSGKVARIVASRPKGDPFGFQVAASPNALLIAAVQDGATLVIDARTGASVNARRGACGSLFFTADGARIIASRAGASGDSGTADLPSVEVWKARTGATVARYSLDAEALNGCSLCWGVSADGTRVAVADAEEGCLYLYDARHGADAVEVPASLERMTSLIFSPDGRLLLTSDRGGAQVRDASSGRAVCGLAAPGGAVQHAAFSPDARWIYTVGADHTVRTWSASTGALLKAHSVAGDGGGFRLVDVSLDGSAVLAVGDDEESYVWRTERAKWDMVASRR